MNSAFYYQGLTDTIPKKYYLITDKDSTKIKDKRVVQYYDNNNSRMIFRLIIIKRLSVTTENLCISWIFRQYRNMQSNCLRQKWLWKHCRWRCFDDPADMGAVARRIESVFRDSAYKSRVDKSDKRWIDDDIPQPYQTQGIRHFHG